jgi:hypothetical protein
MRTTPTTTTPTGTPDAMSEDKMEDLFDRAVETDVARRLLDRLALAWLVDRMTSGKLNVALDAIDDPGTRAAAQAEFACLNDQQRAALLAAVVPDMNESISTAVRHLWHVSRVLNVDPEGLDPDHVALVAAIKLAQAKPALPRVLKYVDEANWYWAVGRSSALHGAPCTTTAPYGAPRRRFASRC